MSRLLRPSLLVLFALVALAPAETRGQATTERIATGFISPVYITSPPGDSTRLFVVEQRGVIKIIKNGVTLGTPFLDIQDLVEDGGNEQGLLGLCFDPDFFDNGWFYVYYTRGNFAGVSAVRRFTVSSDPDVADESTIHRIINVPQLQTNHNGGHIEFGPDGYFYFGLGDGGGANDPGNNGQDLEELLAKMLRLDVHTDDFPADNSRNYGIPPTNPFVADSLALDEIWAWGLRNPYRWSFDRLNGDLWIADVGQNCWEEIHWQEAASTGGENYGWPLMEGNHCFDQGDPFNCNPPGPCGAGLELPVHDFHHSLDGFSCSVTGGYVYRGGAIPAIQGEYFFADFCSDEIYSLDLAGGVVVDTTKWTSDFDQPSYNITDITAFGEDAFGEMYIVSRTGQIFKIVPEPASDVPQVARPATFSLSAPSPNPFTDVARFELALAEPADVSLSVYDSAGRLVRRLHSGRMAAGRSPVHWDGRGEGGAPAPAGVYFLRALTGGETTTQRVTLIR